MKKKYWIISISVVIILSISAYFVFCNSCPGELNRKILDNSLELGKSFLLHNQTETGNFNYEYNFLDKKLEDGDSQVRQAGALWGLALIHKDNPGNDTYTALIKGFDFFRNNSALLENKQRLVNYPGTTYGRTGTMSLVCLAYIEVLTSNYKGDQDSLLKSDFEQYFSFLISLRKNDGHFYSSYYFENGRGFSSPSPYFDGESLLAMVRATEIPEYEYLKSNILSSAESMYQKYYIQARQEEDDSPTTKGFYQWGSMAYLEILTKYKEAIYAERIIDMAYWMIDVHKTLWRTKNTAYAHEGMISAYQAAKLSGNQPAMDKIVKVVDKGLCKLTSWQVEGPLQNRYLRNRPTTDLIAIGGIMNCRNCPVLRIDVTQHQMHAVLLARKYIYTK